MRLANILIPILLPLSVGAAYFAGYHNAKHDAESISKIAVEMGYVEDNAMTLKFVMDAIRRIKASQTDEAHDLLVRFAKLQVLKLEICSQSKECSPLMEKSMPTQVQLAEINELKERRIVSK